MDMATIQTWLEDQLIPEALPFLEYLLQGLGEVWVYVQDWWLYALLVLVLVMLLVSLWRKRQWLQRGSTSLGSWSRSLMRALRYLITRREWRYSTPWTLLVGDPESGKSSLLHSIQSGRRTNLLLREASLAVSDTDWAFFDGGVVIDIHDSAEDDEKASMSRWRSVLDDINAERPERPLDGIVLTLSAQTLLNPPPGGLQALAERNYQRLFELQKRLSFTLPVYILVTQCDAVEGFTAYWQAMGEDRRKEMFGWSNPFNLNHSFDPDWVDQAFAKIGAELRTAQLDAAARKEIDEPDPFFLFPQRFTGLETPLRSVLELIFKPSSYHEDFFVRGVYFSGRVSEKKAPPAKPAKDVSFIEDLFNDRVFCERNLAVPTTHGLWSRNRLLKRVQMGLLIGAVLLGFLLLLAATRLTSQVESSIVGFNAISNPDQLLVTEGPCNAGKPEAIYSLLTDLSEMDSDWRYLLIPMSWFDERAANASSEKISQEIYNAIVFPSLRCRLETRAWALATISPQDAEALSTIASVEINRATDEIERFLRDVRNLKQARERYEFISRSNAGSSQEMRQDMMRQLADLMEYAYGRPLPEAVLQGQGMLISGLGRVRDNTPLKFPSQFEDRVAEGLKERLGLVRSHIHHAVSEGHELAAAIDDESQVIRPQRLAKWLDYVSNDWLSATRDNNPCARIYKQSQHLIEELDQRYGFNHTLDRYFEPYQASSRGPGVCFQNALGRIQATRIAPYGSVASRDVAAGDRDSGLQLASWVAPELEGLAALKELSFAEAKTLTEFSCLSPLQGWDGALIAEANNYARQYQGYRERFKLPSPQQVEQDKKPLYDLLARRQLAAVLNDRMYRAQQPLTLSTTSGEWLSPLSTGDQRLGKRSRAFAITSPKISMLLGLYKQFAIPSQRILTCTRDFAAGELDAANRLAEAANLYEPATDSAAVGASGEDAAAYFDLGSSANAKEYLKQQLERTQVLAGYTEPFVRFLQNTPQATVTGKNTRNGTGFWLSTINEIDRYVQGKDPNGQIAQLENLIGKQLRVMGQGNCNKALAEQAEPDAGTSLFNARYQGLINQAGDYCHSGNVSLARGDYRSLAKRFNAELAGLFPFGPVSNPDASLAITKRFFLDYAAQREGLRAQIKGTGKRWKRINDFLDRLDAASDFFKTSLAAGPQSRPLGVDVAFRYLPSSSDPATDGTSQLIEWRFESGHSEARYPNGNTAVNWQFGQKVDLYLRWAALSSYRPNEDKAPGNLAIEGPEAHFSASGPWALLRLISKHRDDGRGVADPLNDHRVITAFSVPLKFIQPPGSKKKARANLRLALDILANDPKGKPGDQIALPTGFPRKAPYLW